MTSSDPSGRAFPGHPSSMVRLSRVRSPKSPALPTPPIPRDQIPYLAFPTPRRRLLLLLLLLLTQSRLLRGVR
ncbi:hypothetical protein EJB05_38804, partial [Eragrostis curvula]